MGFSRLNAPQTTLSEQTQFEETTVGYCNSCGSRSCRGGCCHSSFSQSCPEASQVTIEQTNVYLGSRQLRWRTEPLVLDALRIEAVLTYAPIEAGSLGIYVNGVFQKPGIDYTLYLDRNVRFAEALPLGTDNYAKYEYSPDTIVFDSIPVGEMVAWSGDPTGAPPHNFLYTNGGTIGGQNSGADHAGESYRALYTKIGNRYTPGNPLVDFDNVPLRLPVATDAHYDGVTLVEVPSIIRFAG